MINLWRCSKKQPRYIVDGTFMTIPMETGNIETPCGENYLFVETDPMNIILFTKTKPQNRAFVHVLEAHSVIFLDGEPLKIVPYSPFKNVAQRNIHIAIATEMGNFCFKLGPIAEQ